MSKELLKTWALTLLKIPALIPTTSNLHWYHVNEISPVCFLALLAYLEGLTISSFCVWIIFYFCLQAICGKCPMQTFGAGEVFPLFFPSLCFLFCYLFYLFYLFCLFLLLSDLRHLAHSPGWIRGNKEERGGVWLRWENLRKLWGKGQKVGCRGGGGIVTIYRRCDGTGWRLCFILGFGRGEEKARAYLATGSREVWHIPVKK